MLMSNLLNDKKVDVYIETNIAGFIETLKSLSPDLYELINDQRNNQELDLLNEDSLRFINNYYNFDSIFKKFLDQNLEYFVSKKDSKRKIGIIGIFSKNEKVYSYYLPYEMNLNQKAMNRLVLNLNLKLT